MDVEKTIGFLLAHEARMAAGIEAHERSRPPVGRVMCQFSRRGPSIRTSHTGIFRVGG